MQNNQRENEVGFICSLCGAEADKSTKATDRCVKCGGELVILAENKAIETEKNFRRNMMKGIAGID